MAIDPALLQMVLSAGDPSDDLGTSGGAAGLFSTGFNYLEMDQLSGNSNVNVVSDNAGDTDDVRITGRDNAGLPIADVITLTGVTPVVSAFSWSYIETFEWLGAVTYLGQISLRTDPGNVDIAILLDTIPMHGRGSMFKNSFSDAVVPLTRYEKAFWRNINADILDSPTITLTLDPLAKILQGIAPVINDTQSVVNRLSVPAGITFVDNNIAQSVPGGVLNQDDLIGIWFRQTLAIDDSAAISTFSSRLDGQDLP